MEKDSLIPHCGILIIGGSAGSLDVLSSLLPKLRSDLSFPIVIVLHRKSNADSVLPSIFAAKTTLVVKEAEDKDILTAGTIYLAPPDYHLLIEKDFSLSLDYSEKVNFSRPSIDVTFETAAEAYGNRTSCLLLSGASADGVEGLKRVQQLGGFSMVQSPETATVSFMPEHAISNLKIDQVLSPNDMPAVINALC